MIKRSDRERAEPKKIGKTFQKDRREILKFVPKLRKIKKGGR
ncbi:MAG: hypothetical protein WCQ99_06715 [Pseudomonadota bacterium]